MLILLPLTTVVSWGWTPADSYSPVQPPQHRLCSCPHLPDPPLFLSWSFPCCLLQSAYKESCSKSIWVQFSTNPAHLYVMQLYLPVPPALPSLVDGTVLQVMGVKHESSAKTGTERGSSPARVLGSVGDVGHGTICLLCPQWQRPCLTLQHIYLLSSYLLFYCQWLITH